jgi:predicted transcriptional regulator
MGTIRRTIELDEERDARLQALAAERGQDPSAIVGEPALELLESVLAVEGPDVAEDIQRLRRFERTGEVIPLEEVKAWVESWGTRNELPAPEPRKVR